MQKDTSVQAICKEAAKHPLLSAEEEHELALRYLNSKDEIAKERLIKSHLRLVIKIARAHAGYKVQMADLISEGNVGLMKALNKFDPEKGNRFSTYAIWWIKAQIREFSMHSYSQVKVGTTAAQKKLFFNLSRLMQNLNINKGDALSQEHIDIIAKTLSVQPHEVTSMAQRMSGHDASLQVTIYDEGESEYQDLLVDDAKNPEQEFADVEEMNIRRGWMKRSLEILSTRERIIFENRQVCEERRTLDELSQKFGISRERVRQIETRAFEKVRKSVRNFAHLSSFPEQIMHVGLS